MYTHVAHDTDLLKVKSHGLLLIILWLVFISFVVSALVRSLSVLQTF